MYFYLAFAGTGTGGSGKSYTTRKLDFSDRSIIFDGAFNSFSSLEKQLKKANDKGFDIEVVAVYNDPITAFKNTLNRGFEKERWLGLNYFIGAFKKNDKKLRELSKAYPNVKIIAYDNSNNITTKANLEDALAWNYDITEKQVVELLKIIDNEKRFKEHQLAAVADELQQITEVDLYRTSEVGRLTERIKVRLSGLQMGRERSGMGTDKTQRVRLDDDIQFSIIGNVKQKVNNVINKKSFKGRDLSNSLEESVRAKNSIKRKAKRLFDKTLRSSGGVDKNVAETARQLDRDMPNIGR